MEFPEKVWVVDPKVNGQHAVGYDFFDTEEDARNSAIAQAKSFIEDIKNADVYDTEASDEVENYYGHKFDFEEHKAEVYTDTATYSWEWSEFSVKAVVDEIIESVRK